MANNCETKDKHIGLGWIKVEGGRFLLKDGGFIPNYPPGAYRSVKVEEFMRKQGITPESAAASKAAMLSAVGSAHAPWMMSLFEGIPMSDGVGTQEDEEKSRAVAQMEQKYRQMYQGGGNSTLNYTQQFFNGVQPPYLTQGVQPPVMPSSQPASMVGSSASTQPDLQQLIQNLGSIVKQVDQLAVST